ncbi:MAG: dTDP-4-dehydrorhamnose reductase [Ignisphaera sp.]
MRILLTGATGLLGYNLLNLLIGKGYEIVATHRKTFVKVGVDNVKWVNIDLENEQEVANVVKDIRPDIVIHAAAYTDVDGCEVYKEKAFKTNYLATKAIAHSASRLGSFIIYVSTDYVFDGEKGMYKESDIPNPVNFYGLTKLLGEIAVLDMFSKSSLVVRTSGLYGYSPTGKKNFGINTLEKLLRSEEVHAFYDQYLSPTYVDALAKRIIEALEKRITGIIHIAGERLSRYEFAMILAKALNVDEVLVKPVSMRDVRLVAKRPRDSSLDTSEAEAGGLNLPPIMECLRHFVNTYRRKVDINNAV